MPVELFANLPSTTVSSGGTTAPASGTSESWTVASSASFPAASSSATPPSQFHVADIAANSEIVTVTNVSGTTWTVTRGAEGSTPVAHAAGFTIYQVVTAGVLTGFLQQASGLVTAYAAPLSTLAAWTSGRDYLASPPASIATGSDGLIYGAALNSGPSWGGAVNPVGDLTGHWVKLTAATGTGPTGATGAGGATGQGFTFKGLYNSGGVTYNPYDAVIQPAVGLCIVPAGSGPFTSGAFNPAQWIILYPNQVESGSGAPSNSLGNNGDTYVDTTGLKIYGPKAAGSWPAGTSIVGATIDTTASDIQPLGTQAAGSSGLAADARHVHPAPAASAAFHPANPNSTSSVSLVMMGAGSTVAYTPAGSGKVLITVTGTTLTATATQPVTLGGRYGTGTAPVNGAAASGTRFGGSADQSLRAAQTSTGIGWALTDIVSLTPGTAYWFDIALATGNASDAASVSTLSFSVAELVS